MTLCQKPSWEREGRGRSRAPLLAPSGVFTSQISFQKSNQTLGKQGKSTGFPVEELCQDGAAINRIISIPGSVFTKHNVSCEIITKSFANWFCLTFYLRDGVLSPCFKFPHRNKPPKKSANWHSQKVKWHIFKRRHDKRADERRRVRFIRCQKKKSQEWLFGGEKLSCNHFIIWRDLWNDSPATVGPKPPILVLAANAKETLKHILDFSSLMFEVKHGPKCSAGLGPICCTTMIKKNKSFQISPYVTFVLKCWGLNDSLWWVLSVSCSFLHHILRPHYQELGKKSWSAVMQRVFVFWEEPMGHCSFL